MKVEYQGQMAEIRALVTPALKDEIILSKKTLKKLTVLPKDFPNVQVVKARAVKGHGGHNYNHGGRGGGRYVQDHRGDQPGSHANFGRCDRRDSDRRLLLGSLGLTCK